MGICALLLNILLYSCGVPAYWVELPGCLTLVSFGEGIGTNGDPEKGMFADWA